MTKSNVCLFGDSYDLKVSYQPFAGKILLETAIEGIVKQVFSVGRTKEWHSGRESADGSLKAMIDVTCFVLNIYGGGTAKIPKKSTHDGSIRAVLAKENLTRRI